jgi:small subunit ribosomal protein S17
MDQTVIKRSLEGIVVSDKMEKTVVVSVERQFGHSKYKKQIKRSARYKAHDAGNTAAVGDRVVIQECRPLSKDKRWILKDIVEKAV